MLKLGILGVGHLGKFHLQQAREIELYDLVGFYDPDKENSEKISKKFDVKSFDSYQSLVEEVDVVDIVVPTISHFELAAYAIKKGKHVFIEKPLSNSLDEAEELLKLVEQYGVKAQVGHIERFNPAFIAAQKYNLKPAFIECDRIATFNPRGTDVSVVLDLMIHDIDIVLSLVDSEVKYISASGVPIVSDTPDIASARIEFENGFVANLTASRISMKQERKMRLFQKDKHIINVIIKYLIFLLFMLI